MKNRWAKLGIVLLAISVLVVGCGGVSIKVLEKKNVLGTEIVNAYVSGFTNTDSTWQKLKSFGDNFDKGGNGNESEKGGRFVGGGFGVVGRMFAQYIRAVE